MRHVLGILGIVAAGVLLAVSAAMNYRFGFSLGRTELDGQIYGAASAAADCLKALAPFFFFAAIKTRMWSQAVASAVVWTIVTAYSFTSCLGHAALNRFAGASERQVEAQTYQDHRADLKRAEDQLGWVPQHRPVATVQSDIDNAKNQRAWNFTNGCSDVTGKQGRDFCQQYHRLTAELAAAAEAGRLEARIAEIQTKLGGTHGGTVMSEADPQAAVLAKILSLDVDKVQMAMTIFIALLLEIGSGFGMYVAFSQWRLYESYAAPARPKRAVETTASTDHAALPAPSVETSLPSTAPEAAIVANAGVAVEAAPADVQATSAPEDIAQPIAALVTPSIANDNKRETVRPMVPESDVQRFYREAVDSRSNSAVSAKEVYKDYLRWCAEIKHKPSAAHLFHREFQELRMQKLDPKRKRYVDIALKSAARSAPAVKETRKPPAPKARAA